METRGLGFHSLPFPLFLSPNLFQNRGFHTDASTLPIYQGPPRLDTNPGFLLRQDWSSNIPLQQDYPRTLPTDSANAHNLHLSSPAQSLAVWRTMSRL